MCALFNYPERGPCQNAAVFTFFSGFFVMKLAVTFCGCFHTSSSAPCQRCFPPSHPWTCYVPKTSGSSTKARPNDILVRTCAVGAPSTCVTCPSCCWVHVLAPNFILYYIKVDQPISPETAHSFYWAKHYHFGQVSRKKDLTDGLLFLYQEEASCRAIHSILLMGMKRAAIFTVQSRGSGSWGASNPDSWQESLRDQFFVKKVETVE